jgi:2-(1,2-epoxy-1,2-dihydrophenyl)acetyl-CoA isomerase
MHYPTLLLERKEGVGLVKMNRPERMNALSADLRADLLACLHDLGQDREIRSIILTGSGKAFSAGGDLNELREKMTVHQSGDYVRGVSRIITTLRSLEKPVIAGVNGAAVGAGFSMVMAADLIVASEKAFFSMAFSKVGLVPDLGANFFAPRLFGNHKAKEMAFFGKTMTARELWDMGFVNYLVEPDALESKMLEVAKDLALGPPLALGLAKKMMDQSWNLDLENMLEVEALAQATCLQSEDFQEGAAAFYEKRPPRFKGE